MTNPGTTATVTMWLRLGRVRTFRCLCCATTPGGTSGGNSGSAIEMIPSTSSTQPGVGLSVESNDGR